MDTLGKRIRFLRNKESQESFASRIGVSKGSIGGYERDENSPSADVILKICSSDNILVEWLMTGKGPMRQGEEAAPQEPVSVPAVAPAQAVCPQCADLLKLVEKERQRLETANERLYEAMRENSELKETIGNLREELAIIKNAQYEEDDEDEGEDTPLANVS